MKNKLMKLKVFLKEEVYKDFCKGRYGNKRVGECNNGIVCTRWSKRKWRILLTNI